jgi:hypothetical protein
MLPSVTRVRVEAARDRVLVLEEIALPRGEWRSGSLDLYAAFGAPGTPIAVDAHLVPVPEGQTESRLEDAGEPVTVEPAVRHTPSSTLLLGRPSMAGVVLRLKEGELRHAYEQSSVASLRIRSLLPPSLPDAKGGRDVVVRLGVEGGLPLALAKVQVVSVDPQLTITRAEAILCGPDADPLPLSVAVLPKPPGAPAWSTTLAPALATRHPSDDLCVRWWTSAPSP